MKNRRLMALYLGILCAVAAVVAAQHAGSFAQTPAVGAAAISTESLREWLTYISSDQLEGRKTFSEGLGLAGAYIAGQLKDAGVKPGGDGGTYFQRVSVDTVRNTGRSSVTAEVNGEVRTFRDGEGVSFPEEVGVRRTFTVDQVEFVGYGLNLGVGRNDYEGRDVKGKAVIWLGDRGPRIQDQRSLRPVLFNRDSLAIEGAGAAAGIGPALEFRRSQGTNSASEFTTTQRLDLPKAPAMVATDEFFEFLFSSSAAKYADLKAKSDRQEPLPVFSLTGVRLTFNIEADYTITNTRYTRNIIGIVEGSDPRLKATYVAFGAHYDHIGYTEHEISPGSDRIFNGADDDGSGTSALIALARLFASGSKPKRSLIFVWHAGEEQGLWGSAYFADHPVVPLESIVAQLNMDMIGRNRGDRDSEANNLLAVGSDRISTDLHNVMIDANNSMPRPLTLDFEMNDPIDPEQIYYRSDHYSYAAKGIPIIFFFAGLHSDYHRVTDEVDKINFDKVTRVAQLVYETGRRLADRDSVPIRDFKGPRLGKGSSGKISSN